MTKSLTESFQAGLPSLSFGAAALISSRAASSLPMLQSTRQIEMRNGLLRLRQPLRDDLAHIVVRHDLVGAGLEQRADFFVGWRLSQARCRSGRRRRRGRRPRELEGLCPLSPPSMSRAMTRPCGPVPWMRAEVEAGFLGEPPGQRRSKDALVP